MAPKTPTETFQRARIQQQTQLQLQTTTKSPLSPNIQQQNSATLISTSTTNQRQLNYTTNVQQQNDSNFAIIDINPGLFFNFYFKFNKYKNIFLRTTVPLDGRCRPKINASSNWFN